MQRYISRLTGTVLTIVVVFLVLVSVAGSEVRGQDVAPGTPTGTQAEVFEPAPTGVPVEQPQAEAPAVFDQADVLGSETPLATETPVPSEEPVAMVSTDTPSLASNEFPRLEKTASESLNQAAGSETITAQLRTAICGNLWRFSITGLQEADAPPFISVGFATSGTVIAEMQFTASTGIAFYYVEGVRDDTVLIATAIVPAGFSGVFQLDTMRCTAPATRTPIVIAPQTPTATATATSSVRTTPTQTPTPSPTRKSGSLSTPTSFSIPR